MLANRIAFFRCEASPKIGGGHAMRSSVLADALATEGWKCSFVTSQDSYDFMPALSRFERVDPETFYANPKPCDLLVVDHYDLDASYEKHFRDHAKKILVIDDLANRQHICDFLLDQTYGRQESDYKNLVPEDCAILTGSTYALIRPEFLEWRGKAIEKRKNTQEIKRILINMGGNDAQNCTLEVLKLIQESGFKGAIDIVLGFAAPHMESIKSFLKSMPNHATIISNANMPELMYEADLAVGAAGSSVWERCCLGLPSVLVCLADNQKTIYNDLLSTGNFWALEGFVKNYKSFKASKFIAKMVDGFGVNRILLKLIDTYNPLILKDVTEQDKELIFTWQNIKEIRQYFNNPYLPTYEEHTKWFKERLIQYGNPYWIIYVGNEPIGNISLTYDLNKQYYDLSWYILPSYQGKGLGTKALQLAVFMVAPMSIHAFAKKENIASQKSLEKAGFKVLSKGYYVFDWPKHTDAC